MFKFKNYHIIYIINYYINSMITYKFMSFCIIYHKIILLYVRNLKSKILKMFKFKNYHVIYIINYYINSMITYKFTYHKIILFYFMLEI